MKKMVRNTIVGAAVLATTTASAATWKAGNTDVSLKGYVKLDWVHVEGAGSSNALNKQLTVPSTISADSNGGSNGFQVWQSRFGIGTATDTAMGKAKTYIEMDYYLSGQGDERISNSESPRLRHAFFSVGKWTFGQTWSNFMILPALNEQLDFGGYAGTNFVRQGMIKYSTKVGSWMWETSLENAETTGAQGGDTLGAAITASNDEDGGLPDIISKLTHSGNYGTFSFAAMFRSHELESVAGDDTGVALTAGGKFKYMGKNDVRYSVSWGNMGRYGSFTAFDDVVSKSVNGKNELESTEAMQWHVGVRHFITDKTRINLDYGVGTMDTFGASEIEEVNTIHANLIRQPMKSFQYGVEWSQVNVTRFGATKTAAKADEVSGQRYMFSAQYNF